MGFRSPLQPEEQNKGGGKYRHQGRIRNAAMFRKLRNRRNRRNLQAGASDREAGIGFSGRASAIARVHHEGRPDKPAIAAAPVRYPRRVLLGITNSESPRLLDMMFIHFAQ